MSTDSALPCLVLVPGLACDDAVWAPVLPHLGGRSRPWVPPAEVLHRIPDMAAAVLRQAPAERFALAGHSLGGRIAMEVMRQAPQRVLRLALLNTGWQGLAPGDVGEAERTQRLSLVALAQRDGMPAMGAQWAPPMLNPRRLGTPVYKQVLDMIGAQSVERFAAQQQALLARPDAGDVLDAVTCPTLLLSGQEDGWSPPQRHAEMAARIAGSRLVVVPDCGHMSPMEQPEAVGQALVHWLATDD